MVRRRTSIRQWQDPNRENRERKHGREEEEEEEEEDAGHF